MLNTTNRTDGEGSRSSKEDSELRSISVSPGRSLVLRGNIGAACNITVIRTGRTSSFIALGWMAPRRDSSLIVLGGITVFTLRSLEVNATLIVHCLWQTRLVSSNSIQSTV